MKKRTEPFVATSAWLAAAMLAAAQTQQQAPPPVFRSGVDLVHFDVSVLDKARKPVRGLTAADFTILEDGKPQEIAAFTAVDVPVPELPKTRWTREFAPDVRANDAAQNPEGRLFVLLLDDALMPPEPWAVQKTKKIAQGVLDRLSPGDQMAVVFTFSSRNSQDFTTDRSKLIKAIDAFSYGTASHLLGWDNAVPLNPRIPFGPMVPAVDGDAQLRVGSLRTLQAVADNLISAPQRRKALIYVSPGVTVDLEGDARPVRSAGNDPGMPIREANHQLATEMPEVFRRMQRANVTVYSVDPMGMSGMEAYIREASRPVRALQNPSSSLPADFNWLAPNGTPSPEALARHAARLDMDFLMAAASNTGGKAIVNTNDFDPGLDGIFEENASYYLLGYSKPAKNGIGDLHRVSVKVNRPGLTVRTRTGYETLPDDKPDPSMPASSALKRAAAGPVANGDLPLQVAVASVAVRDRKEAAVTIALGMRQPAVTTRAQQTIYFQVATYTPDGRAVGAPFRQSATFTLVPSGGDTARYELLTQLALAPGRYEVRLAAHRESDGLSGSVYTDVEVPDFSKVPLSLSGVWLDATPGVSAVPRDAFAAILTGLATSSREFRTSDKATASFRVYQGGDAPLAPVALKVRLLDERDAVIVDSTGTLGVDRFAPATRSAEHHFGLPLQALAPGMYLLTFDATLGEVTVRRHVVFTVAK